MKSSYTEHWY